MSIEYLSSFFITIILMLGNLRLKLTSGVPYLSFLEMRIKTHEMHFSFYAYVAGD